MGFIKAYSHSILKSTLTNDSLILMHGWMKKKMHLLSLKLIHSKGGVTFGWGRSWRSDVWWHGPTSSCRCQKGNFTIFSWLAEALQSWSVNQTGDRDTYRRIHRAVDSFTFGSWTHTTEDDVVGVRPSGEGPVSAAVFNAGKVAVVWQNSNSPTA